MSSTEQIIKEYIRAYNAFDIPKMLSLFSDDCIFENVSNSSPRTTIQGLKELEKTARQSAQLFQQREQKITHQVLTQNEAAIQIEYRAVLAVDLPSGLKAGQTLELHGASFFQFQNGKIKKLTDVS